MAAAHGGGGPGRVPLKPLGGKAYGHIPHLPGSKVGPGDHTINAGQARICTEPQGVATVWVQEKLDGSCVAAALVGDQVLALTRAGYIATTSPFAQHWLWAWWVRRHEDRFRAVLRPGERICGEWLAQAHGRVYTELDEPFVAFDLIAGAGNEARRLTVPLLAERVAVGQFPVPATWAGPMPVEDAMGLAWERGLHSPEGPEGVVYRAERGSRVLFLAKHVRPDAEPGRYLDGPERWVWAP